jgi:hypothetical protein
MPSPEQPTTYQKAVAEITTNSALLVLGVHKLRSKCKAWETVLENKIPSTLTRSVFAANFRLITGHYYLQRQLNRIRIKDSPKCPLYDDAEGLDHTQKCQSLTDSMDSANNRDKWWNLSKLYWTARKKMGDIPLTGLGQKKKIFESKFRGRTTCFWGQVGYSNLSTHHDIKHRCPYYQAVIGRSSNRPAETNVPRYGHVPEVGGEGICHQSSAHIGNHILCRKCVFAEVETAMKGVRSDWRMKMAFPAVWEAGAGVGAGVAFYVTSSSSGDLDLRAFR